jgi:hypothetical protein
MSSRFNRLASSARCCRASLMAGGDRLVEAGDLVGHAASLGEQRQLVRAEFEGVVGDVLPERPSGLLQATRRGRELVVISHFGGSWGR